MAIRRRTAQNSETSNYSASHHSQSVRNIFELEKLEKVHDLANLTPYRVLAEKEIKDFVRKIRKNMPTQKRLYESGITMSRKSYTIRTHELD